MTGSRMRKVLPKQRKHVVSVLIYVRKGRRRATLSVSKGLAADLFRSAERATILVDEQRMEVGVKPDHAGDFAVNRQHGHCCVTLDSAMNAIGFDPDFRIKTRFEPPYRVEDGMVVIDLQRVHDGAYGTDAETQ